MIRRLVTAVVAIAGVALILFGLCFFGVWIPNEPSRSKYPIRGVDVSHHQGDINWSAVRDSQISFAYIKATEGVDFRDAKFSENWQRSHAAGLTHGAYHFFLLGKPGAPQAANFIATVPVEPDALPPAIDLEFSGYNRNQQLSQADFQRELSTFWDAIVAQYAKTPVVYTTSDFQKQYLARMPVARLWLREVFLTPRQPWLFWQFSPRGQLRGVPTFVDLNVFYGGLTEFQHIIQTSEQM
jgi:lysozyme